MLQVQRLLKSLVTGPESTLGNTKLRLKVLSLKSLDNKCVHHWIPLARSHWLHGNRGDCLMLPSVSLEAKSSAENSLALPFKFVISHVSQVNVCMPPFLPVLSFLLWLTSCSLHVLDALAKAALARAIHNQEKLEPWLLGDIREPLWYDKVCDSFFLQDDRYLNSVFQYHWSKTFCLLKPDSTDKQMLPFSFICIFFPIYL